MNKVKESLEDTIQFVKDYWGPLLATIALIVFLVFLGSNIYYADSIFTQARELCEPEKLASFTASMREGESLVTCYDESTDTLSIKRVVTVKAYWQ